MVIRSGRSDVSKPVKNWRAEHFQSINWAGLLPPTVWSLLLVTHSFWISFMLSLELPLSLLPENIGLEIKFWNPIGKYTRLRMKQVFLASCFWKIQVQMSHILDTESEVLTTTEATDLTPEWYPHNKFHYFTLHEAQIWWYIPSSCWVNEAFKHRSTVFSET